MTKYRTVNVSRSNNRFEMVHVDMSKSPSYAMGLTEATSYDISMDDFPTVQDIMNEALRRFNELGHLKAGQII